MRWPVLSNMIIHAFYVVSCARKHGFYYTTLANRFIERYGKFFAEQEAKAVRVLQSLGYTVEDFADATVKYPRQFLSHEFCNNLGRALLARVEDVKVVERGIEAQRQAPKARFSAMRAILQENANEEVSIWSKATRNAKPH